MNRPVAFLPTAPEIQGEGDRALRESLDLLEWPLVCSHLSNFASTGMGRIAARDLPLPDSVQHSRQRQAETVEMAALDDPTDGGISFRGCRI